MSEDWSAFPAVPADDWSAFPAVPPSHPVAGASGNLLTDAGRVAGTVGANVAAAALSTPRSIAQGVDWLAGNVGLHPGASDALGSIKDPSGSGQPMFPDFPTARDMAFNITGGTEFQPQSWWGRRGMDALTGGALAATGNWKAIPAAVAGSATGGAAAEAFPNHPLIASMLGFIPGAAVGNAALNVPMRVSAALKGDTANPTYAAFQRQNLPTDLAGTTTGSHGLLWAEKWAGRMPGSEGTMAETRGKLIDAWQNRLGEIADGLGKSSTPAEAGTALQANASQWLQNFKDTTGKLWTDFYAKVPKDTPVEVSNYSGALKDVLGEFDGAQKTGAILQPKSVKALSKALGVDLGDGTSLPWNAVKSIRSAIGEKIENPTTIADTSQAALRRLYGGLTKDMEAGAQSVGDDALAAFHTANDATRTGHQLLEGYLNPILKAQSPEQATQYALSQARLGGDRISTIAGALPGASGEVASYALRNAATNAESPTALANALAGRKPIYSKEAMAALYPDQTRAQIEDMITTGRAMQPVERDMANSVTSTHEARGVGRIITAMEMRKLGDELAGHYGGAAGFGLGFMAPDISGRIAQALALNPKMAAIYGNQIPVQLAKPSMLSRALMSPALAPGAPGLPALAPATSASSGQR